MGNIAYNLLKNKVLLGVSSRGLGDLDEVTEGTDITKYYMVAEDIVADPSAPDCFVDGILESREYILESNGDIREYEKAYNTLDAKLAKLGNSDRNRILTEAISEFFRNMKRRWVI